MFGKKILLLAIGYFAGNMVSSVYNGGKKIKKKTENKENIKVMFENFLDTQKNLITDIEKKYLSVEKQKSFKKKKKEISKIAKKYIKQGKNILEEVQKNEKIIEGKKRTGGFFSDIKEKAKITFGEGEDSAQTQERKK